jgi:hypothetical protein
MLSSLYVAIFFSFAKAKYLFSLLKHYTKLNAKDSKIHYDGKDY